MKILVVNPFPPAGGGAAVQQSLMKTLRRLNLGEVGVFDCSCELKFIEYARSAAGAWGNRKILNDADLIIFQSPLTPSVIVLTMCALRKRKPYMMIPHGEFIPPPNYFSFVRKPFLKWFLWISIIRLLMAKAKAVVLNSALEKGRFLRVGARADNIHIIPHVFESAQEELSAASESSGWKENRPFALFLGRISKEKGLSLLIKIWPEIVKRVPNALLILAGPIEHPEEFQSLKRLCRKLRLEESVVFSSWVQGEFKKQLLKTARCLVLPSLYESFGYVVPEAVAHGTPVIVSEGTPWAHMDGIAGRCIPRKKDVWLKALLPYLAPPQKIFLEESLIEKMLEPFRIQNIVPLWKRVIDQSMQGQVHQTAFSSPSAVTV